MLPMQSYCTLTNGYRGWNSPPSNWLVAGHDTMSHVIPTISQHVINICMYSFMSTLHMMFELKVI